MRTAREIYWRHLARYEMQMTAAIVAICIVLPFAFWRF